MAKKQAGGSPSKRQMVREQRLRRQRQQRLSVILGIGAVALVLAVLFIIPNLWQAAQPAGDVVQITPNAYPQPEGTALGNPNAPVKVEVWEDFQCPSCRTYSEDIESQLVANEVANGQVYYVFRHYPFLDSQVITKESQQSANASMCAAEQGRFWDYHDMLFANWDGENDGAFNDKRLVAFAEAIDLDMNAFNACFRENRYKQQIQDDYNAGVKAGVTGTPSVFVDGKQITPGYVPSYEAIQQAVQEAVAVD